MVLPNKTSLSRKILVQYQNNNALNTTGIPDRNNCILAQITMREMYVNTTENRTGTQLEQSNTTVDGSDLLKMPNLLQLKEKTNKRTRTNKQSKHANSANSANRTYRWWPPTGYLHRLFLRSSSSPEVRDRRIDGMRSTC